MKREMKTELTEDQEREIDRLEREIRICEHWLEQTSNPMKAKRRKRDIRDYKKRIEEIKSSLPSSIT